MTEYSTASTSNQRELFSFPTDEPFSRSEPASTRRQFISPDREKLFFGARTLRSHLVQCGRHEILRLSQSLDALDWTTFEERYAGPGRPPYAPRLMTGLIIYGLLKGITSLRDMETLSQLDLGCMWICAGIQPDHSNIGRFILRHQNTFDGPFFEQVTRMALRATNSGVTDVAGDGTVIQAATSRYHTIKREALDKKLAQSRQAVNRTPDDPDARSTLTRYEKADAALKQREEKREKKGKPIIDLRVSPTEPDATLQPLKNKSFAPSYKPSVLANEARVIVGKAVHSSDEISVIPQMLNEAEEIGKAKISRLMLDGNYCTETVINEALARDIDLLCPEQGCRPTSRERFLKTDFSYDSERDVYICPAGQELTPRTRSKDGSYMQYERRGCQRCPLRNRCFSQKSERRVIRRLAIDDAKDALRQVMLQPQAQKEYSRRKAMVEPVFSFLVGAMNFRRFRRRGIEKVSLEFSLQAAAYNFGRILRALCAVPAIFRLLHHLWSARQMVNVLPFFINPSVAGETMA
jgi:transposase